MLGVGPSQSAAKHELSKRNGCSLDVPGIDLQTDLCDGQIDVLK